MFSQRRKKETFDVANATVGVWYGVETSLRDSGTVGLYS